LSISRLVTFTFDLLTFKLLRFIAHGVGNLPMNILVFLGLFILGQHLSDAPPWCPFDLAAQRYQDSVRQSAEGIVVIDTPHLQFSLLAALGK